MAGGRATRSVEFSWPPASCSKEEEEEEEEAQTSFAQRCGTLPMLICAEIAVEANRWPEKRYG